MREVQPITIDYKASLLIESCVLSFLDRIGAAQVFCIFLVSIYLWTRYFMWQRVKTFKAGIHTGRLIYSVRLSRCTSLLHLLQNKRDKLWFLKKLSGTCNELDLLVLSTHTEQTLSRYRDRAARCWSYLIRSRELQVFNVTKTIKLLRKTCLPRLTCEIQTRLSSTEYWSCSWKSRKSPSSSWASWESYPQVLRRGGWAPKIDVWLGNTKGFGTNRCKRLRSDYKLNCTDLNKYARPTVNEPDIENPMLQSVRWAATHQHIPGSLWMVRYVGSFWKKHAMEEFTL